MLKLVEINRLLSAVAGEHNKVVTNVTLFGIFSAQIIATIARYSLPICARKPLRDVAPSAIAIKFSFSIFFLTRGAQHIVPSRARGRGHPTSIQSNK